MAETKTRLLTDIAALRACGLVSKSVLYVVLSTGAIYKYDSSSAAVDEGDQIVKPTRNSGNGRFLRMQGDQLTAPGQKAMNILRLASNVADTETITIGADVYELDRAADGVTAGRIAITGHSDDTPANASTAIVARINAAVGVEKVTAVRVSANEILLLSTNPGAITIACTETLGGANNAWAAANMYGGKTPAIWKTSVQTRVPTATEVALGNMHFAFDFVPAVAIVFVTVTATPDLAVAHDGSVTIDATNKKVTVDNAGSTDWSASHTLSVLALA